MRAIQRDLVSNLALYWWNFVLFECLPTMFGLFLKTLYLGLARFGLVRIMRASSPGESGNWQRFWRFPGGKNLVEVKVEIKCLQAGSDAYNAPPQQRAPGFAVGKKVGL
ncbi:hypothetical protein [Gilvimarinus chinensis]|uniref:hypothetical protein n=1 Tax=Gilvimarinus chinensis TaxID=396005 RepID=UPI00036B689B|nr:hypothetical protein [Gilvimarinus chinensis]